MKAKYVGYGLLCLLGILALTWIVQGNQFFLYKFFAPKTEDVRREVFENTKSYNQGMVQELQNMQFEYIKAKPEQQKALASIILHRVSDFDESKLPSDLRSFIDGLRNERTKGWAR
jgi:hypothetical protein